MKKIFPPLLMLILVTISVSAQNALLRDYGTARQLCVGGEPYLILGGELDNSSATSKEDIDRIFPKLAEMNLNTVLVPAYWDLVEPVEGEFDFELIDHTLCVARESGIKVIFLWFGAWKNSMSCHAPLWVKQDYQKYPRAYTKEGKPLEIASLFSKSVLEADCRAFSEFIRHLAKVDKSHGTVIMVQIENEVGMLEDARDHSPQANKEFAAVVPSQLMKYLQKHKNRLHPQMAEKWSRGGYRTGGSWSEVFGEDIYTEEIFMAYHYAKYIEELAKVARREYDMPLFVNAAMNSRGRKPGEYPSAGPLAHLIDVWRCGAPSIDFISPDIYDKGFADWVAQYALPNNPLFVPEVRMSDDNGVRAFYVLGEHDAIGISPFAIEGGKVSSPLTAGYATLNELLPLIAQHQGQGTMYGLLFDMQRRERIINRDGMKITARHFFTLPWDSRATDGSVWSEGGGVVIKLADKEYIVAGKGIVLTFESEDESSRGAQELGEDGFVAVGGKSIENRGWSGTSRIGIGSVEQISIEPNGDFKYIRRLNGDQTHQGRHVRIGVDGFEILHVKLYEYR